MPLSNTGLVWLLACTWRAVQAAGCALFVLFLTEANAWLDPNNDAYWPIYKHLEGVVCEDRRGSGVRFRNGVVSNLHALAVARKFLLFQNRLGDVPSAADARLWREAVTPRSAGGRGACEQLARAGDRLLLAGVMQELRRVQPRASRGQLHDLCQHYITNEALSRVGDELRLDLFIEPLNGLPLSAREKTTVVEALLGAAEQAHGRGWGLCSVWNVMQLVDGIRLD